MNLYYTVEKETETYGLVDELTGWKTITVYEIVDNKPKEICQLPANNEDTSTDEISLWLDENGYGDKSYKFTLL